MLAAGLVQGGYVAGGLVIFFTLQYLKNGAIGLDSIQKWWGNTVGKMGSTRGEKSGIKCGQTRKGSPGLCTSIYDVRINVLSVCEWKEN